MCGTRDYEPPCVLKWSKLTIVEGSREEHLCVLLRRVCIARIACLNRVAGGAARGGTGHSEPSLTLYSISSVCIRSMPGECLGDCCCVVQVAEGAASVSVLEVQLQMGIAHWHPLLLSLVILLD